MDVRARWQRLVGDDGSFDDVEARYAEPQRAYHTTAHVEQVLATIDELGNNDPGVTDAMHERLDAAARANLAREIEALTPSS